MTENSNPSTSMTKSFDRSKKSSKKKPPLPPDHQRLCLFCGEGDEYANELECGEFREPTNKQFSVHYFCLLLASDLQQKRNYDEARDPLGGFSSTAINKRKNGSYKQFCHYCGKKSATIKCAFDGCAVRFHLPCGRKNRSFHGFHDAYESFCRDHWPLKILSIVWDQSELDNKECSLCRDVFSEESTQTLLFTDCCRNSKGPVRKIYHRQCIQNTAIHFGHYHLKCPNCSDKDTFKQTLIDAGIYVPIRDATWEDGRFRDHYVGLTECKALQCKCPRGREFGTNRNNTNGDDDAMDETAASVESSDDRWRMVKCYYCGETRHVACMCGPVSYVDEDGNEQESHQCYVCGKKDEPIGNICAKKEEPIGNIFELFDRDREKRRSIDSAGSRPSSSMADGSSGFSDDRETMIVVVDDHHQPMNQRSTAADESTIDMMDEECPSIKSDGSLPAINDETNAHDQEEVVHMDEDETEKLSAKDSIDTSTISIRSRAESILDSVAVEETTTIGDRSMPVATVGDLNSKRRSSIGFVVETSSPVSSAASIRSRAESILESIAMESTTNGGGPTTMPPSADFDVICLSDDDEDVGTNGVEKSAGDSAGKERKKKKKRKKNREKAARDDIMIIDDEDQPSTSKKPRTPTSPSKNTNHQHNNNAMDLEKNASVEGMDDDDEIQCLANFEPSTKAYQKLVCSTIRENMVYRIGLLKESISKK